MKTIIKFDRIIFLLLFFLFFLVMLFYYLHNIDKEIERYNYEHDQIVALKLLDKDINNFSLTRNKFNDYDTINLKLQTFEKTFSHLKKNIFAYNPKNSEFQKELSDISKSFDEKKENVNYFKSLNASLISGSHFLFDLQITIENEKNIPMKDKLLVNEALFYLLRFTTSEYIKKEYVSKKLIEIKKLDKKVTSKYLQTFYKHSNIMLHTTASLKEVSTDIQTSSLYKFLDKLHQNFDAIYHENLHIQKNIATAFFFLTIIILLVVIKMHLSALKTRQELLAFKFAMQHSDNTILITDKEKHITFVNDVFEKTTGYTFQEALGKNPNILKSGKQDDAFYVELNTKLSQGLKWEGEFVNRRKDGSLFYEKASIVPVFLDNELINYLAIKLDITEYIEQNKKLAQAASVYEYSEEAIIIADAYGRVTSVNSAFGSIYGYSLKEVEGKTLNFLQSGNKDKSFYKNMWNQLKMNGIWRGKFVNKTKFGNHIPVWTTIKEIKNEKGEVVNYIALQTDLRELERSEAKIDYLAYHDSLTGLYNRVNFEEYLTHALSLAKRKASLVAIMFIDLDRFKIINDTLGHDIGDEVLIHTSKILKETLRESDFISRWGGDEFVVIIEDISSASDIAIIATNLIEKLQEPMQIETHRLTITASIGIALYPENGEDTNTLIKHADSAMYLAKDMGKNNFRYYTNELSEKIQSKLNIDMQLHNALKNNELYMVFQPQYRLKDKKIQSLEALIRWNSKRLGFVPPDIFIPVAEENGTIINIGYFVFEESCKAFRKIKDANVDIKYVAINVSSAQFRESRLLENFISIVQRHNLEPSDIEIEITERLIMTQSKENMNLLQNFRDVGFKISIDDFGTGYSSMSYLKHLPIDTIKIDKSFIDDINQDKASNVVIEAIIALSKTLQYQIVAEGIETQEQEDFLNVSNCDLGQGYLFSRPITQEEIIQTFTS